VSDATGMSRNTIRRGVQELEVRKKKPKAAVESRLRRKGGGRKCLTESDPGLLEALEVLVEPMSRGDPESPLRWTCKSTARLAEELTRQEHPIGAWSVGASGNSRASPKRWTCTTSRTRTWARSFPRECSI
jgi:hypothetical protein